MAAVAGRFRVPPSSDRPGLAPGVHSRFTVFGMKTTALLIATVLALPACAIERDKSATGLTDLSGSLDAVRAEFNAHRDEARFLTLLSPT